MARKINRLNARMVPTIKTFGRHADGGGLYLSISPNGGRRWVFLFRWHGKLTEIGFGSARDVTLSRARDRAAQARLMLTEGINPKDASKPKKEATFGECADRVIEAKLYRYYVSTDVLKRDAEACPVRRVPAAEIESAVIEQVRAVLRSPEIIVRTWRVARQSMDGLTEADVREALERLDPLWDELFPAEQARIVQLLVERVDMTTEGADIRLRTQGLTSLVADLSVIQPEKRRAA